MTDHTAPAPAWVDTTTAAEAQALREDVRRLQATLRDVRRQMRERTQERDEALAGLRAATADLRRAAAAEAMG